MRDGGTKRGGDAAGGIADSDAAPPQATTLNGAESGQVGEPSTAARAIEEADVIKLSGDRLYALSEYGGLSVIDISDPDQLQLLGRHRSTATPFEMYVREESVFVLYNGYGEYEYNEDQDQWTFYQTSYVISLDAADPANITEAQKFEIEGYIADSRLIGDVIYVAAFDDSMVLVSPPTTDR